METHQRAEVEFFSQGWEHFLDELISTARERLILVAPFIKKYPLKRIAKQLSSIPLSSRPEITILTDLNQNSLLQNTLEITALVDFVRDLQKVEIKSLNRLHAKVYIANKNKAIVTSANLTLSGLRSNAEYGVIIRNSEKAARVHKDVVSYLKNSVPFSYEELQELCNEIIANPNYKPIHIPIVKNVTPSVAIPQETSALDQEYPQLGEFCYLLTKEESRYFKAVDEKDWLTVYRQEASQVPLLTAEEEVNLAKRMESGLAARERLETLGGIFPSDEIQDGEEAKEHLIWANTRLVIHKAKKYKGSGVPFLDLIQEGNIGLILATDKFEYRRGNRFSTYATWWIQQTVSRAVPKHKRTIHLPFGMDDQLHRLRKIQDQLMQELRRAPTINEIALGFSSDPKEHAQFVEKIKRLREISRHPVSLDKLLDDHSDGAYWDIDASMSEEDYIEFVEASFSMDDQFNIDTFLDEEDESKFVRASSDMHSDEDFPYTDKSESTSDPLNGDDDVNNYDIETLISEEDEVEIAESSFNVDLIKGFPQIPSPVEEVARRIDVRSSLETLNKREAQILRLRFGLNGDNQEYTLKELGERLKVSRERVRQIEKRALARLANSSTSASLRLYLDA